MPNAMKHNGAEPCDDIFEQAEMHAVGVTTSAQKKDARLSDQKNKRSAIEKIANASAIIIFLLYGICVIHWAGIATLTHWGILKKSLELGIQVYVLSILPMLFTLPLGVVFIFLPTITRLVRISLIALLLCAVFLYFSEY